MASFRSGGFSSRICVLGNTLSTLEVAMGALKTTGLSAAHIANMWSVKGGSTVGREIECREQPFPFVSSSA
ncbi:hypothetical protein Tco_1384858 [Tanacetum coccineum]